MDIRIVETPITLADVRQAAAASYGDMVKAVVDIEKRILALGGEMHADAEAVLLQAGSTQDNLWGINLYPDLPANQWIRFESLINVRPQANNRSMEIQDSEIKETIRAIVGSLITR